MALTNKLSAIGEAIRAKTGKSDLLTLDQMPTEIASISGGGGEDLPEEAFHFTGIGKYLFANDHWTWFINKYGNRITTEAITFPENLFSFSAGLEYIPFTVDLNTGTYSCGGLFEGCSKLKEVPRVTGVLSTNCADMFTGCTDLRYIPESKFEGVEWKNVSSPKMSGLVQGCQSLREAPVWIFNKIPYGSKATYASNCYWYGWYNLTSLDELVNLPLPYTTTTSNNLFAYSLYGFGRAKNVTFALNPETNAPYEINWQNQVIDLSNSNQATGYLSAPYYYNSGITADKEVVDDATYQALKNDPDWFTNLAAYSRYNHDSAVATINSLPDCSSSGGTNTIKFTGLAGEKTDGGAINTLTEEEIAVATAKGWTVTFTGG